MMRIPCLRDLVLLLLLPALTLHCGVAAPTQSRSLSARASAVLAQAPMVYAPAASGGSATAELQALRSTFEAALNPQARARVRHEPALDLVAAAVAENFSDQSANASRPLLQWMLWRSGSLALYHEQVGGWAADGAHTRASGGRKDTARLEEWAATAAQHASATPSSLLSYGLARFTEGRVTSEAIVFGWTSFEADSFSKTYAPGGPLTLVLRPRSPFKRLRFLLGSEDAVEEQALDPREDGSFFLSRSVPMKPGRYFIEIQGPAPRRATLLVVPIYVGVPEPTTPDDFIQRPPPGPPDAAGWPAWLASTYDAERSRLGKPPVAVDARLGALAAERSALVAVGQRVPAIDGDFSARLTAAGLSATGFFETVTTVRGTDGVLFNLLRPSVRKQLLMSDRVVFGAGAAARPARAQQVPSVTLVEDSVAASGEVPAAAVAP